MLESITVKNLALIKHAELELGEGLNILSGETGAGKSILIGSVNYCLGAKADKSMIREGAEHALMELVFRVENEETIDAIRAMELPVEEDGRVIISRRITAKSSSIRVCGESVSASQVRELASLLIDVHGQHEHQSLLHAARHLELLDAGLPDTAKKELESIKELYAAYRELRAKQERLLLDEGKRERELSLAEYEIGEIEAAGLKPGEEAELEERYRRMKKGRDAFENLHRVQELLMEDGGGALEGLGRAVHELRSAASGDDTLTDCAGMLSDAESMVRDCLREVDDYLESSLFDPQYFDETEKRLDELRRIIARYGQDEESVLAYLEERKKEAEELRDLDSTREKLEKQLKEIKEKLDKCCDSLHKKRVKAAETLEKEVMGVLTDLNFLKADFKVQLRESAEPGPKGRDEA